MADLAIFLLFFFAIVIGWVLGRRRPPSSSVHAQYFERVGNQGDALEREPGRYPAIPSESRDSPRSRMAEAAELRRRGEVEGAVRIHQGLLSRQTLSIDEASRARVELARDYISAGLLDRAEEVLLELVADCPDQGETGRRHLLEVYEIERDWRRAIEVASELLPKRLQRRQPAASAFQPWQPTVLLLAHYCCELADEERLQGRHDDARKLLRRALASDKLCVRASLLLGQVEYAEGHYQEAIHALRRVRTQDAAYLPETIPLLRRCHDALDTPGVLREYLDECLTAHPTPALVTAIAEDMVGVEGREATLAFLSIRLLEQPSLPGLSQLIDLQYNASEGDARENLATLQTLTGRLLAPRPVYRCLHCGFAGKHLHWHCPGCKHWGSIRALGSN